MLQSISPSYPTSKAKERRFMTRLVVQKRDLSCNSSTDGVENQNDNDDNPGESDYSVDFVWEVGDAEEDLDALEKAIIRDNAEENLRQAERLETLEAYAAQRRPLLSDVHLFFSATVVWSLVFVGLKKLLRRSPNKLAKMIDPRWFALPWDTHFWVVVVAAPILFLQHKRATMGEPPPLPQHLKGLPLEYLRSSAAMMAMTDWEDPETSCRDYVLCLAEQWVSAVKGAAGFGAFMVLCAAVLRLPNRLVVVPVFSPFAVALVQFVTRLGAVFSVFQFPKLLFELQRPQQPRPVKAQVARLQGLVGSLFSWSIPVGLASDFSKLLMTLRGRGLVAFSGMVIAFLGALEIHYNQSRTSPPHGQSGWIERATRGLVKAFEFLLTTGLPSAMMVASSLFVITNLWKPSKNLGRMFTMIPWLVLVSNGALLLALLRPIWHIFAFSRILEIVYTHDMSLTTELNVMKETLLNPEERGKRFKWRTRLRWRDPERVKVLVDRKWQQYWQWFFLSGNVQDKLMRDSIAQDEVTNKLDNQHEKLWERLEREIENEPSELPKPDRRLWKQEAMENVAAFHQAQYDEFKRLKEAGNSTAGTLSDPLGTALQQRLNIGLHFTDDHTVALKKGEVPSTLRLQSRAAKSAIERVNQLWGEANLARSQVDKEIKDDKERETKLKEIDDKLQSEVDYLAKRLSELTPTTASGKTINFKFFDMWTKPIVVGGQKVMISDTAPKERSISLERIMKLNEVDDAANGESGDNPQQDSESTQPYDYTQDVEEALRDYYERQAAEEATIGKVSYVSKERHDDPDSDDQGCGSGEVPVSKEDYSSIEVGSESQSDLHQGEIVGNETEDCMPSKSEEDDEVEYLRQLFGGRAVGDPIDKDDASNKDGDDDETGGMPKHVC